MPSVGKAPISRHPRPLAERAGEKSRLAARLRAAGLEGVRQPAPGLVSGWLAGSGALTVALIAGCGPGAEAGRRAALAAAADLARTPRAHAFELVLCGRREAAGERPALAWLAARPAAGERLLAVLLLEPGAGRGRRAAVRMLPSADAAEHRLPPAWLVHAALGAARAVPAELAVGEGRWPLLAQLLGRYGRPRAVSGGPSLLAAGVPALALAGGGDGEGAAGGVALVAAIVRRLDGLAGRPRPGDVYLALGGRVWARRDLYWIGLAVWSLLLLRGLPGAWRGRSGGERRRRGRGYLPGFAFRMLLLGALLLAPVAALTLLVPAALLTLAPARRPAAVTVVRALALLPALVLAGHLAVSAITGRAAPWPAQPLQLSLVLAGLFLAIRRIGGAADPPPAPPGW